MFDRSLLPEFDRSLKSHPGIKQVEKPVKFLLSFILFIAIGLIGRLQPLLRLFETLIDVQFNGLNKCIMFNSSVALMPKQNGLKPF